MKTQELILAQTDKRIRKFAKITEDTPPKGWIYTLRTSLGMSMRQLGKIANITPQGVKDIESREKEGNITIAALEQLGKKLDMKLVYGFVPSEGSLQKKIDKQSLIKAKNIATKTSKSMELENKNVSKAMLNSFVRNTAMKIKINSPRKLWD